MYGEFTKLYAIFKRTVTFKSGVNKATTVDRDQFYNPYKTTQVTASKIGENVYYVEYTKGNITYKIWVEDNDSFAKKLELVNKYKLAGAAYWRKGFDNSSIWKVIKNTLNLN